MIKTKQTYQNYKDTDIVWLDKLPADWSTAKFQYYYYSSMGQTLLKEDIEDEGKIPIYSATEKEEIFGYVDSANVILEKGDLVIPARGNSIGHVKLVNRKSTTTQTTIYSKCLKPGRVDSRYIKYFLNAFRKTLFFFDQTAIPQITVDQVNSNSLVLPPKKEQQKIANYLDEKTSKVDKLIEKNNKLIELLKEKRQAVITKAVTKGIDRYASMKDSDVEWIGEIPEGWDTIKMRFAVDEYNGYGFPNSLQGNEDGDYPFYKVSDINFSGKVLERANNYVDKETIKNKGWSLISSNSIITAKIGEALKKNHRKINSDKCLIDNNMMALSLRSKELSLPFVYYLFKVIDMEWFLNPGAVPSVSMRQFRDSYIPYPSKKEQNKIVQFIKNKTSKIDNLVEKLKEENKKLKEYKKTLISKVVTGKIKV